MTTQSPLATQEPWNLVAFDYALEVVPQFELFAADALALADRPAAARVLDVACGPGTLTLLAARTAARVDAVDFAPAMIAKLRERLTASGLANVECREADGQALPFEDKTFDAAFSMFGLMFFPDRARGLSELRRVLVPGSPCVVSSWQPFDRAPVLHRVLQRLGERLPNLPFGNSKGPLADPDEFRTELAAAGFHDVSVVERTHGYDQPSMAEFWASLQRTLAPILLLQKKMGPEWSPIAASMRDALLAEFGAGPVRVDMPAWLGVGHA